MGKVKNIIKKQLSYEFDIKEEDFSNKANIFSTKKHDKDFLYNNQTSGTIISYKNKLLVRSENKELLEELKYKYRFYPAPWFTEAKNIYELDEILDKYGLKIRNIFPVYVPKFIEEVETSDKFFWIKEKDFDDYKKDKKYNFVFSYEKGELGLGYKDGGDIVGLASASKGARYFYDIGLEKYIFDKKYKKVASNLLKYLTYHILTEETERIPLCSTQFSHTKSLNLMVNAGYRQIFTNISIDWFKKILIQRVNLI